MYSCILRFHVLKFALLYLQIWYHASLLVYPASSVTSLITLTTSKNQFNFIDPFPHMLKKTLVWRSSFILKNPKKNRFLSLKKMKGTRTYSKLD